MEEQIVIDTNKPYILPFFWDGETPEVSYDITLTVPGASLEMVGLVLGQQQSNLHLTVNVTHAAPRTASHVVVNGVLKDAANVSFDGLVTINHGAKQAKARLDSHVLLLSDNAKGRVVPSLEIKENDVKAGHAATVGKVDPIQLFYLQSRGLSTQVAKRLLVEGFLRSTIEKLPENLKKRALKEISIYVG